MRFREWLLLQESIIVNTGREEVPLGKSNEASKVVEFSYATDNHYSSFEIWPFSEDRPGYVFTGNATVLGIIKNTPIFADNGADRAFIQALTSALNSSGYKALPYKEGESAWMGVFKGAGADDESLLGSMKGEKDTGKATAPKMGEKAAADRKLTSGISVSRASGSWAYFIRINAGDADSYIRTVERLMKATIKPLVDNNLVDYYRIVRGRNYKGEEWVWSEKGRREKDEVRGAADKSAAYMKFLADRMLANHPKAKEAVLGHFRHSWNKDVKPSNERVPMDELKSYVRDSHGESPFLYFFLDTIQGNNQRMYEVLEDAANTPNYNDAISIYREIDGDEYEYMIEEPRLWMTQAIKIFSLSDFLHKNSRSHFEKFKSGYEDALNRWLKSGPTIRPMELKHLKELSDYIEVHDKDRIIDAHDKHEKANREFNRRQEEEYRKADELLLKKKQVIALGQFKYLMLGRDSSWSDISHKYINNYDEVDVGLMALEEDLVDRESIMHSAHEKASEDAMADAEERKSETYGHDREEVEGDIDYEWDDYMDDREFDEGEFDGLSEDQKKAKIKEDYLDDFVGWKKERLQKEEEEEGWKYDPEPEDSDIRKYEEEFAEAQAYEGGLVWMRWVDDESRDIEVFAHHKHYEKAREMVRKNLADGMEINDKHGEPLIRRDQRVEFELVGDGDHSKATSMRAGQV